MKKRLYSMGLLLVVGFTPSCNKYLEVSPDSSHDIVIDTEDKISEILTDAYPTASYFPFMELRTDNVVEREGGEQTELGQSMYYWQDYDQEDLDTPLNYWVSCYHGIAQANQALELLASRPKTDRVKALYGEAFLLRAYLHFMLTNLWAEPYKGEHSSDLGIPYITKSEKNAFVDYKRGTVAEDYAAIEKDLRLGISLVDDRYYAKPAYHFTRKAAYAFATRFYLYKGDWASVVAYSDYVLGADPSQKLRKWIDYSDRYDGNRGLVWRTYAATKEPANLLLTTTESRWARMLPASRYGVNYDLMDKIFNKAGIEGDANLSSLNLSSLYCFSSSPSSVQYGYYIAKFDELSLLGSTSSTRPRDIYSTNVLFTTDEVLLNRMEAYTMLRDYDKAVKDLLVYMNAKFKATPKAGDEADYFAPEMHNITSTSSTNYASYAPFYGLTLKQLALVKTIAGFRQKEFLHEGLRWLDIRRFHMALTRTGGNASYRPLSADDPRKTLQIPTEAISRGLEPNFRDRPEVAPHF